jgi:molecular chaperone DnaK
MIIGIDLGTSTSEVAILRNGKPMLLREIAGAPHGILPSVVTIDSDGEIKVGELAEKLLIVKPHLCVQEIKRRMGEEERVTLGSEEFKPQEISAMILRHLKQQAEIFLGEPVTEAVITVPAHFDEIQRRATRDAGEMAGLKVRRLLNEPTAAALAYGIDRPGIEEMVAVYDLGGGTLDVTVLELSEGILDILASTGNRELGGKDFDERLMAHLVEECKKTTGIDLGSSTLDQRRRLTLKAQLKSVAKRAKEELSVSKTAQVSMPFIGIEKDGSPINFDYTLTRATFEGLIGDLVQGTRAFLDEALAAKKLTPAAIDTVLLVGGSTRIPLVREFVSSYFGGRTLRTEVNPDEAVALGAAVLSGIESGSIDTKDIILTDVSNWTLGVSVLQEREGEVIHDNFDPLIEKFSTVPRSAKKSYRTAHDFQELVRVEVYQGDAPFCKDNKFLGTVDLDLSDPAPAGQPIEVEFSYDLNEELRVTARDLRSGQEVRAHFQPDGNRMTDAEKKAGKDRINQKSQATGSNTRKIERAQSSARPAEAPPAAPAAVAGDDWKKSHLYASVAALMTHAEKRQAGVNATLRPTVVQLLAEMKAALAGANEANLRIAENKLTDLLFDLD